MCVKYVLYENKLVAGATDYIARVMPVRTVSLQEVADLMVQHGSTVTKADILAVQEDTILITEQLLKLGFKVNTGLCSVYPVIKGRFDNSVSAFDPLIHRVDIGACATARIKEFAQSNLEVEREASTTLRPTLNEYIDAKSGENNSTLSIGSIGEIRGSNLKFESLIPDEGLFFLADGQEEVKASIFLTTTDSRIAFQVPDTLLPGTFYRMLVRTRYTDGGTLREGKFLAELETPA